MGKHNLFFLFIALFLCRPTYQRPSIGLRFSVNPSDQSVKERLENIEYNQRLLGKSSESSQSAIAKNRELLIDVEQKYERLKSAKRTGIDTRKMLVRLIVELNSQGIKTDGVIV